MPMKRSALLNDDRVARDAKQDCCSRSTLDPVFFWFKRRTVEREREKEREQSKRRKEIASQKEKQEESINTYFYTYTLHVIKEKKRKAVDCL